MLLNRLARHRRLNGGTLQLQCTTSESDDRTVPGTMTTEGFVSVRLSSSVTLGAIAGIFTDLGNIHTILSSA
ncbi:hypothetical protein PC116_g23140 [Phytophthora cactorum]|uniref:Uncharacterized protein n=1 Tax=Phytophthora cactorum TaxID=29920 RepID=A0A8T1ALB0_9STRA|nr:hypothetical protein PC114_g23616 [Phytophthora cactorum]KAG2885228.1 hypothetical protein PC115_g21068 [Phytophthora cactorum]KAG2894659.1 hypothetical protein PC117_g23426 [Phytophthora cactorum]KAG2972455.1 hypothetical protein PC119_g23162 [Phytophthora cactorum]KAG3049805.1 hypothetical protein PC121_g18731 [Phytophthora cactorum]